MKQQVAQVCADELSLLSLGQARVNAMENSRSSKNLHKSLIRQDSHRIKDWITVAILFWSERMWQAAKIRMRPKAVISPDRLDLQW
jgi:hypothetical protein